MVRWIGASLRRAPSRQTLLTDLDCRRLVLGEAPLHDRARQNANEPSRLRRQARARDRAPRASGKPSSSGSDASSVVVRRLGDVHAARPSRGSRPAATTSRTSVLRVITPTSVPSSEDTNTARIFRAVFEAAARVLRTRLVQESVVGSGTIASRGGMRRSRIDPPRLERARDLADRQRPSPPDGT